MSTVRLTRDLLAEGFSPTELARRTRAGDLVHLRRGAYDSAATDDPAVRHLAQLEATVRLAAADAVVSHLSAAVLHGLPVVTSRLGRVELTRAGVPGGKNRGGIHLHAAPLDAADIAVVRGIRATSLARTVVDIGRTSAFTEAVMTGDAALRGALSSSEVQACLLRSVRRPGVAQARRVASFLDGLSESPGESLSRVALHEVRLPPPTLQFEVRDGSGRLVGRSDFAWEEQRTLGEFDGRVKYGRLLKPGQTAGDVIYAEKLREDAMRDLGWQVVRWTHPDLARFEVVAERLLRAFARSAG